MKTVFSLHTHQDVSEFGRLETTQHVKYTIGDIVSFRENDLDTFKIPRQVCNGTFYCHSVTFFPLEDLCEIVCCSYKDNTDSAKITWARQDAGLIEKVF